MRGGGGGGGGTVMCDPHRGKRDSEMSSYRSRLTREHRLQRRIRLKKTMGGGEGLEIARPKARGKDNFTQTPNIALILWLSNLV